MVFVGYVVIFRYEGKVNKEEILKYRKGLYWVNLGFYVMGYLL